MMFAFSVIPGRAKGASPESNANPFEYGFLARRTQPSLRRLRELACDAAPQNDPELDVLP
jgi:hypothetical protein